MEMLPMLNTFRHFIYIVATFNDKCTTNIGISVITADVEKQRSFLGFQIPFLFLQSQRHPMAPGTCIFLLIFSHNASSPRLQAS